MTIKLQIVKVPRLGKIPDLPIKFPPLPDLHLELLENKKKLKPNLPLIQPIRKIIKKISPPELDARISPKELTQRISAPTLESPKKEVKTSPIKKSPSSETHTEQDSTEGEDHTDRDDDHIETDEPDDDYKNNSEDEDLVNVLGESDDEENKKKHNPVKHKDKPKDREKPEEEKEEEDHKETEEDKTEEKENKEHLEVEYEEEVSPEEKEKQDKEMLIWKFRIMRKQYKTRTDIPQYNEHSDLKMMKTNYERLIKEINLDESADTYRTYLIIMFFAVEYFMTMWANIDMRGLAKFHMQSMNKYERLLIELGERPYNNIFTKLPVEVRLLGFIAIQTGLFWIGKTMSENSPSGISTLFKMFAGTGNVSSTPNQQEEKDSDEEQPKRKMKGPSVQV